MDLRITIKDEDGRKLMNKLTIYQEGSDAEGVERIKDWLLNEFAVESNTKCSNAHCVDGMVVIGFLKDNYFPCPSCSIDELTVQLKEEEDEPEKTV